MSGPRVLLHVGEPKSGTTFLQQVMWANRDALAAQGVVLPGMHLQDHFRANQDLREVEQAADDPAGSYRGEWDLLVAQALQAPKTAVISHELLAGATRPQAARALASLRGAEVHIVLTVRDFASLLPAEWQETVKHRNRRAWEPWVRQLMRSSRTPATRSSRWFWQAHDTLDVLARWTQATADTPAIPPERVHVVTVPPSGSSPTRLWERFADVLGVAADSVDLTAARPNASLGLAETELLRRVNEALDPEVPHWFYSVWVKEYLAHDVLAARPATQRPQLPPKQFGWARRQAQATAAGLREAGYDVVGDLADLVPAGRGRRQAARGVQPAAADDVLDAAVVSLAELLHKQYAGPRRESRSRELSGFLDHAGARIAASPWLKRTIREVSARFPAVGRARILLWRVGERARSRRGGPGR